MGKGTSRKRERKGARSFRGVKNHMFLRIKAFLRLVSGIFNVYVGFCLGLIHVIMWKNT